jgi:hypothetical protein
MIFDLTEFNLYVYFIIVYDFALILRWLRTRAISSEDVISNR